MVTSDIETALSEVIERLAELRDSVGGTATVVGVPCDDGIGHYECGECRGTVGHRDAYCRWCGARLEA